MVLIAAGVFNQRPHLPRRHCSIVLLAYARGGAQNIVSSEP
jgi:hypothetical protein